VNSIAFNKNNDYFIESSVVSVEGRYHFDNTLFEASGIGQYIFKKVDASIYLYQVIHSDKRTLTNAWHVGTDYTYANSPLLSCGYASSSSGSSSSSKSSDRRRIRRRLGGKGSSGNSKNSPSTGSKHSCISANARWFKGTTGNTLDKEFEVRKIKRNVQSVKNIIHKDICVSYVGTPPAAGFDFVGAYHVYGSTVTTGGQDEFFPGVVWVKNSNSPSQYIYFLGDSTQAFIYMDIDTDVTNGVHFRCDLGDGFDSASLPEITDCPLNQWEIIDSGQFDDDMMTTHCDDDFYSDSICIEDKKESEANSASDGVYKYQPFGSGIWTGAIYEKLDATRFVYPYEFTASSEAFIGWGIWDVATQAGDPIWRCGFKKSALPITTPFISNIFQDCDTNDWDLKSGGSFATNTQLKIVRCPTTIKSN
jgi:hypothetical protein